VLPQVLISPIAGVLNDRLPRRHVMIFADIVRFFVVLGMMWGVRTGSTPLIYAMLFAESVLWGLFEPGRDSLLPNLTRGDRETLAANTLSSATWSFNLAAGTALGGLLAAAFGRDVVFAVNAASFLASAALLLRLRVAETHTAGSPPLRARDLVNFGPVAEGFRYIRASPRLLATLLAKSGLGVIGANHVVLPLMGERVFRVGGQAILGMSLLMTARGLGSLLGPTLSGYWAGGQADRMRRGILYAFLAIAAGYSVVWWSPTVAWAIAGVVLAHAGGATIWVFSTTLLQGQAEDRFRGRVFSADYAFNIVSMSLSTWVGGVAVDAGLPVRGVALGMAALVLVPAVAWAVWAMPLWERARVK
jgi:MFS family permease